MAAFKLVLLAIVVVVATSVGGQPIILDEHLQPIIIVESPGSLILDEPGNLVPTAHRVRRDAPPSYGPPPVHHQPSYEKKYTPGKVGPVYTFVKTDYHGNFKWGVRHRAGSKYAGSYH